MTMLDVFKSRSPEGLTVVKSTKRGDWHKLTLVYNETECSVDLRATCVPKEENNICDYTIATAMMSIALKRNDIEMCQYWRNFQDEIFKKPKTHGGKRTNAGRKPNATPTKPLGVRVTEEEAIKIKEFLAELRKEK